MSPNITLNRIERGIYEGALGKQKAIVAFRARNRTHENYVNSSVVFTPGQINRARVLAKQRGLPALVAINVFLKGKQRYSYAVPIDSWNKLHTGAAEFPLSVKARGILDNDKHVVKDFRIVPQPEPTVNGPRQPRATNGRRSKQEATAEKPPGNGNGKMTDKEMVDSIARSVASATLGNATVQVQPQTREELWNNIHRGVAVGLREIGFRP